MKESTANEVSSVLQEAEEILTDLRTIDDLGYPTQQLWLIGVKIEMRLNALRRGAWLKSWHASWLAAHNAHYQRLREQMV